MKVKIAIEQEFEMNDESIFDEESMETDLDTRIDYLVNRFAEDIDSLVKYDEVRNAISVTYEEV